MEAIPLTELPVHEESVWLDHVWQASSTTAGNSRTLLMSEPQTAGPTLRDAAVVAVRNKDEGTYRNPIQKLLFLS